jgi:hypothetical protein
LKRIEKGPMPLDGGNKRKKKTKACCDNFPDAVARHGNAVRKQDTPHNTRFKRRKGGDKKKKKNRIDPTRE